jgi:hypothetical protein
MTEEEFLRSFAQKENQISRTAIPSKRQVRTFVERRKGHRMTSERMQKIMRQQTPDGTRAIYQSAKKAASGWNNIDVCDESVATRNVGPSDLPRSTSGKQTIGPRTY